MKNRPHDPATHSLHLNKRMPPYRAAYVFFATQRGRPAPRWYHRALWWLTKTLTRSDITHVSVGFDGAVVDPAIVGNRFWPLDVYWRRYPALVGFYLVPLKAPLYLDQFPADVPKPAWPTVLRWLTRGAVRTSDCVCMATDLLRQGGVVVPDQITTPVQLFEWLRVQEFLFHARASSPEHDPGADQLPRSDHPGTDGM